MLELLETFCAVAEAGSLNAATERLHLTQPAITRQLRALEHRLGAVLLTRSSRGVTLTPVGLAVLGHARQALAAVRACEEAAADASPGGTARLRVASGLMATLYVLPPVLTRFRELHPDVEVDLQPTHQRMAVELLLGYRVDAAVIASPVQSAQVRETAILRDPLLLVAAPGAAATPVRLADLHNRTLIVLPSGTGLHAQVEAALKERGVSCQMVQYPTAETIKTAVAIGVGAAILPSSAVRAEVAAGLLSVRPIADWPGATRVIRLLTRVEGRPPRVVTAFAALLQEHYPGD